MATYGSVSIGTAATLIVEANSQRLSLVLTNTGNAVWIGPDVNISTQNSPHLSGSSGVFAEDSGGTKMYCGPFYGACSAGTSTVFWWERQR